MEGVLRTVALIRQKVSPRGGAEGVVHRLAADFSSRGYEVHVLAADWEDAIPGVQYHRMKLRKTFSWQGPLSFQRSAAEFLAHHSFDIVHGFDKTYPVDVYRAGDGSHRTWMRHAAANQSWPAGLLARLNPKHRVLLRLERDLLRHPKLKKIIANSQLVKNDLMRDHGIPPEKIAVIPNGVDLSVHQPPASREERAARKSSLGISPDTTLLLFVGSNFERKGLRYAVEALAAHKDNNLMLLVAGKGKENIYQRMAQSLGVGRKIKFLGAVRDTRPLYQAADIFILPTLYDPFSNVCLEAMASGLPVITTPQNGASEILEQGKTGFIASPQDMSQALSSALSRDLWQLGKSAAQEAQHHAFSRMADQTLRLYSCSR